MKTNAFLACASTALCWEGPASGSGILVNDCTVCIQCSKSLQVLSEEPLANCCSQGLGEKQAYTWMPEPTSPMENHTARQLTCSERNLGGSDMPVYTRTHKLGFSF